MRTDGHQLEAEENRARLERFCHRLIEFISAQATDPHLYFQNKLTGDVAQAKNTADVWALAERLITWVEASNPHASAISKLDNELAKEALPSYTLIARPSNRELGRILAGGRIVGEEEFKLVKSHVDRGAGLGEADRGLCGRLMQIYESRK